MAEISSLWTLTVIFGKFTVLPESSSSIDRVLTCWTYLSLSWRLPPNHFFCNFQALVFRTQFVLLTTVKCSYDFLLLGSPLFVNGLYKRNNGLWFWTTDGQDMIHGFRHICVRLFWRTSKSILFSSFPDHGLAQRFGTICYPCEHSFIRVAQNQCFFFLPNVSISV